MKYWEIIADNLSKAGWSWGCVSAIDSNGRTIWIADAHRGDGKRFVVRAEEKLTAFLNSPTLLLVRRVFIERSAGILFVVAKSPAVRFGERSDLRFALSAIVGLTWDKSGCIRAMFRFLEFLRNSAREYFHSRGQKTFGFKVLRFLRKGPLSDSSRKNPQKVSSTETFFVGKTVSPCQSGFFL